MHLYAEVQDWARKPVECDANIGLLRIVTRAAQDQFVRETGDPVGRISHVDAASDGGGVHNAVPGVCGRHERLVGPAHSCLAEHVRERFLGPKFLKADYIRRNPIEHFARPRDLLDIDALIPTVGVAIYSLVRDL